MSTLGSSPSVELFCFSMLLSGNKFYTLEKFLLLLILNTLLAAISVNIVESFCICFSSLLFNCIFVGSVIFCRASVNSTVSLTSIDLVDNELIFTLLGKIILYPLLWFSCLCYVYLKASVMVWGWT